MEISKFEEARRVINWLEANNFEGAVNVIMRGTFEIKAKEIVLKQETLLPPQTYLPKVSKALNSIQWGHPGTHEKWNKIIIRRLQENNIETIEDLCKLTFDDLIQLKGIREGIANIIRDSLRRNNYELDK